ncbi:Ig-like domain-containing protein [Massilia horti]|nr:Ig-like domain-containing protein [Massilia horti]
MPMRWTLLLAGLLGVGAVQAAEYWLRTGTTTVAGVPMWGYALCGTGSAPPATCAGQVTVPGPLLAVPPGEGLVVHLTNTLPEPTSLVIAGQVKQEGMQPVWFEPNQPGTTYSGARPAGNTSARVRSFDREAATGGGSATYTWANLKPGTYLYRSGTHPQVQVQMGLYGAVTKDAGPGRVAYTQGTASVTYVNQMLMLFSEIDPALHAAVANGTYGGSGPTSTLAYHPRFFLINGKTFPDAGLDPLVPPTLPPGQQTVPAGQDLLLRLVNAGLMTHVPTIAGQYWRVVAEDGNPVPVLAYPRQQYSAFLAPGKTLDVLLKPDNPNSSSVRYPIFDSRYYDTNDGQPGGGMFARIEVGPAVAAPPVFDSVPVTTGRVGTAWQYQAHATASGGHPVQYAFVTPPATPAGMTINGTTGLATWPAANVAAGSYPITVRATDTVASLSTDQAFTLTVASNTQPVARDDSYTAVAHAATFGNQALAGPGVLANDTDADGDVLTAAKLTECILNSANNCAGNSNRITLAANGSLTLASSTATSNLRMTYQVSDGTQFSAPANVTITMVDNRAPTANADSFTVPRCTFRQGNSSNCRTGTGFYQPPTLDLASNDSDPDADTLDRANQLPLAVARVRTAATGTGAGSVTSTQTSSGGTVTVSGGSVTYTPLYNFTGTDTFSYRVKDKLGKESGSISSNTDNLGAGWAVVTLRVQ